MLTTQVGGMDKLLRKEGGSINQLKEFLQKHLTTELLSGIMKLTN